MRTLNGRTQRRVLRNGKWIALPASQWELSNLISSLHIDSLESLKKMFPDTFKSIIQRRD